MYKRQNEVPYLRSVASPWDSETVDITRSKEVDDSTLTNTLGSSQLAVLSYYDNGYVKTVQAGSQQYTGRQIREMLGLASSCFTIAVSYTHLVSRLTVLGMAVI